MTEERLVRAEDFDFDLPASLIAQAPAARRTDSRLLVLAGDDAMHHRHFRDLPTLLRPGDLLVRNETRVIPARLRLRRASGGAVEVFLVRREADGWSAFLKPAKRIRAGEELLGVDGGDGDVRVRVTAVEGGMATVRLPARGAAGEAAFLAAHGEIPLPPYIRRDADTADADRYQTVFARDAGAVAAPTAGLHFDEALLAGIEAKGVTIRGLVLHVGPGTFRPLPEGVDLDSHSLEAERFVLPAETAQAVLATRAAGGRVIAVGTTCVRTLETWAARGASPEGATGETDLFVRPPFAFGAVDALITNFHLPKSSLLCLVSAFVGWRRVRAAYEEAVAREYRFYSYGDAMFLERAS